MNRLVSLASLAAVLGLSVDARPQVPAHPVVRCPATWSSDPVLVVDVAGTTLGGMVSRHLVVYSDGRAMLAERATRDEPARVETATIAPGFVEQLRLDLEYAGAFDACDDTAVVADVPLTTVTVFDRGRHARTNTFHYLVPGPGQASTHLVIDLFVATHLPGS